VQIGILVGLAVIAASAVFLRSKGGKAAKKKKSTSSKNQSTNSEVSSTPPRISKAAVGSVATPAGRRSARIARKNAD
jgi:gas vesicle protein